MRADADESARLAADRLGLRISELVDAPSHHVAAALLQGVWRADSPDSVVNAALMTALAHAGNYVAGAYQGERMVAAAVGFLGVGHLHSHVAGVDRTIRTGGIGFALKQHQRAWALARSITEVCWTFDPLVSRNAYFNLHKLGGSATEYLPDFYGELADGINLGDPTDRLYVRWRLESPAAVAAANGYPADVDAVAMRAEGAAVLVDRVGPLGQFEAPSAEGWALGYERPSVTGGSLPRLPADGRALLVAVPEDIETLRSHDPGAATQWRYAVRGALAEALDAGYRVDGFSRDGFYALAAGERA
jgi:predicted GNAT superfamily acetyltransferase